MVALLEKLEHGGTHCFCLVTHLKKDII